jgi:hypothetical protein
MIKTKGSLLVLVLLVSAALLFFGLALISLQRSGSTIGQRARDRLIAEAAASAGLDDAIYQLKKDAGWRAGFQASVLPHSKATYTVCFDPGQSQTPFSTNNLDGAAAVTGFGGRQVPPNSAHIISLGAFNGTRVTEETLVSSRNFPFKLAGFANRTIILNGNALIDSFDSSAGAYAVSRRESGGDMGTNSGEAGAVVLRGSSLIKGSVSVGPGGSESTSVTRSAGSSYQSFRVNDRQTDLPFIEPPTGASQGPANASGTSTIRLSPGVYTTLSGKGGSTIQLEAGAYVFSGDISFSGNSRLLLPSDSGSVTIYALGDISITGNSLVNDTLQPSKLLIYGGPDTVSIAVSGNGQAYLALYAPAAAFTNSGNIDIYGAAVVGSLTLKGSSAMHYDKALIKVSAGGPCQTMTILSRW